jgi:hypothetical protein
MQRTPEDLSLVIDSDFDGLADLDARFSRRPPSCAGTAN